MNENDIRPRCNDELAESARQKDIDFLIKRKENFIVVNCPACGVENTNVEMKKNGFTYLECKNCSMLYISPRPTEEILSEFYPQSKLYEVFNTHIFPQSADVRREKIFRPRVKKIISYCEQYNVNRDSILEIGSGFGFLLEELADANAFKRIVGTEATDSLYDSIKEKKYELYNGLLDSINFEETFNFIASFEVIEHVFNPKQFLNKINSILDKEGIIMLSFPNYDGFDIGILREEASAIDHEHLNYFNEKSISILLESTGFNLLDIHTPGLLDVDIVKSAIDKGQIKNSFLRRLLCSDDPPLMNKFQNFLIENKLSSHMIVVAQKK